AVSSEFFASRSLTAQPPMYGTPTTLERRPSSPALLWGASNCGDRNDNQPLSEVHPSSPAKPGDTLVAYRHPVQRPLKGHRNRRVALHWLPAPLTRVIPNAPPPHRCPQDAC